MKLAPQGEAAEEEAPREEIKIEVTGLADIAALEGICSELAKKAKWAAVDADTAFTLATDIGNYSLALGGGDLLTPGVTEEDALSAAAAIRSVLFIFSPLST